MGKFEYRDLTDEEVANLEPVRQMQEVVERHKDKPDVGRKRQAALHCEANLAKTRMKHAKYSTEYRANRDYGPQKSVYTEGAKDRLVTFAEDLFPVMEEIWADEELRSLDRIAETVTSENQHEINMFRLIIDHQVAKALCKAHDALMTLRKSRFQLEFLQKVSEDPSHRLSINVPKEDPREAFQRAMGKLFGGK